jgi:hypothetical protein
MVKNKQPLQDAPTIGEMMNGYGKIPEKEWTAERDKLLAKRYSNCDAYYKLREDVQSVETLQRNAENLMRGITPERTEERKRGLLV